MGCQQLRRETDAEVAEGFALIDPGLRLLEVNAALAAIGGQPAAEHLGRTIAEALPALAPALEPLLRQALATGEPLLDSAVPDPHEPHEPDSRLRVSCHPVRSLRGAVIAVDLIVRPPSAPPPAPAPHRPEPIDPRASEERWRSLLSSIDQGFCIFEMLYDESGAAVDYRFLEVNSTFARHTGLSDAVGKTARELVPGLEAHWVEAYAQVAETGVPMRFEQGSEAMSRWFEVNATRIGAAGSRQVALLFTDVTERKRAEAERAVLLGQVQQALQTTEAALAEARAATRERDLLISIAAHDLRTPLTVILGQAQLLGRRAERAGLDEQSRRKVAMIAEQAGRLNQMMEALLDLSRIQEGRLMIQPEPLDLAELLARVVDEVRLTLADHPISLQLPEAPIPISADPLRLAQVFHNLLGNAVKYSPGGGAIVVRASAAAAEARVAVSDQGIGVPAEAMPHLFTRFYRAPNAAAQTTSSMGVGLYVVRELVHAHGGSIAVESTEGVGSTFVVRLPRAGAAAAP